MTDAFVPQPPQADRRQLATLEHVVLRFCYGLPLGYVLIGQRPVGNEVLRAVVLELDTIRARFCSCRDHAACQLHVAVVINPDLGGQETRLPRSDQPFADTNGNHAPTSMAATTRSAPRPSTSSRPSTDIRRSNWSSPRTRQNTCAISRSVTPSCQPRFSATPRSPNPAAIPVWSREIA